MRQKLLILGFPFQSPYICPRQEVTRLSLSAMGWLLSWDGTHRIEKLRNLKIEDDPAEQRDPLSS
jgi:hypothetical protein